MGWFGGQSFKVTSKISTHVFLSCPFLSLGLLIASFIKETGSPPTWVVVITRSLGIKVESGRKDPTLSGSTSPDLKEPAKRRDTMHQKRDLFGGGQLDSSILDQIRRKTWGVTASRLADSGWIFSQPCTRRSTRGSRSGELWPWIWCR